MAREMMDIGVNEDGSFKIADGDFVVEESTAAHQTSLILDAPGDYKDYPLMCVGAPMYIDDEGPEALIRKIAQEFMNDGMVIVNMDPNPAAAADSTVKPFLNAFYK